MKHAKFTPIIKNMILIVAFNLLSLPVAYDRAFDNLYALEYMLVLSAVFATLYSTVKGKYEKTYTYIAVTLITQVATSAAASAVIWLITRDKVGAAVVRPDPAAIMIIYMLTISLLDLVETKIRQWNKSKERVTSTLAWIWHDLATVTVFALAILLVLYLMNISVLRGYANAIAVIFILSAVYARFYFAGRRACKGAYRYGALAIAAYLVISIPIFAVMFNKASIGFFSASPYLTVGISLAVYMVELVVYDLIASGISAWREEKMRQTLPEALISATMPPDAQ